MKISPTYYYTRDDLEPNPGKATPSPFILNDLVRTDLEAIATRIQKEGYCEIDKETIASRPELSLYVSFLQLLGAVKVTKSQHRLRVTPSNHLARDLPYILSLYLKHGLVLFNDWSRRAKGLRGRLSALEFLHYIERERVDRSKATGIQPEVMRRIPVAFAIIKGRSENRGCDVYLLELNKDWNLYNLIGGKQESKDHGSYRETLLREIEEELGISRDRVLVTHLFEKPLDDAYSLSGSHGSLAQYPCMLFSVVILGDFSKRDKDRWFSEKELREMRKSQEPRLLINPQYLDFLLDRMEGGLSVLPYSIEKSIDSCSILQRLHTLVRKHSDWIVPALKILSAALAILAGLIVLVRLLGAP